MHSKSWVQMKRKNINKMWTHYEDIWKQFLHFRKKNENLQRVWIKGGV